VSAVSSSESKTPASEIKRRGNRVSRGPWTIYAAASGPTTGRLTAALGRAAGGSVTRSRVRRIARDVFQQLRKTEPNVDVLLLARGDLSSEPRRNIRRNLQGLMARGMGTVSQRRLLQEVVSG